MTEFKNFTEEISAIHKWEIEFIKYIQSIANEPLTEMAKIFTDGVTYVFFVLACLIFIWCIDYKKGLHLSYLISFGGGLLEGLKNFLHVPRPYIYAPEIMLKKQSGFATPSGHSFSSAMMYSAVLFYNQKIKMKKSIRLALVIILPFLVGLSRIYLGVHYPSDVLLGWILGILASIIFIFITPKLDTKVSKFADSVYKISNKNIKSVKFAVAAIFSFIIIIVYQEKTYLAGTLFGLAFGDIYILEPSEYIFDASSGCIAKKIIRLILGLILISLPILIYLFFEINENNAQFRLYNFLEFALVGVIASGFAPLIFCKLKLCEQNKKTEEREN